MVLSISSNHTQNYFLVKCLVSVYYENLVGAIMKQTGLWKKQMSIVIVGIWLLTTCMLLFGCIASPVSSPRNSIVTASITATETLETQPADIIASESNLSPYPDALKPSPPLNLSLYRNEPLLSSDEINWADSLRPGGVIFHNNLFHMFFVGQSKDRSGLGYATSPDGLNWEISLKTPILTPQDMEDLPLDAKVMDASILVENDETWVLNFTVFASHNFSIWRATAPAPTGPWSVDKGPVLSPDGLGAWDEHGVSHPSVTKTSDGYVMFFSGIGRFANSVGMATSQDGHNWVKYDDPATTDTRFASSDPVIRDPTDTGDQIADYQLNAPSAWVTPDGWGMVYSITPNGGSVTGDSVIGFTTLTENGWQPYDESPILNTLSRTNWSISMILQDGAYFLYFSNDPKFLNSGKIYLATGTINQDK